MTGEVLTREAVVKDAAVLIMDGVESTAIANVLGPKKYDEDYIQSLHACYRSVLASAKLVPQVVEDPAKETEKLTVFYESAYRLGETCFVNWAGDEFSAAFSAGHAGKDTLAALWMATEIIMRWFQREPNLSRLRQGSDPFELSCGIHYGPITLAHRRLLGNEFQWKPEGIAFAYAKRVQSQARDAICPKMFVTEDVKLREPEIREAMKELGIPFANWETEEKEVRVLKGLGPKRVFEVKRFLPPEMLIMPDRFDALYDLFMKYPIQASLAYYVYMYLRDTGDKSRAAKLQERFKSIGHIFTDDSEKNT